MASLRRAPAYTNTPGGEAPSSCIPQDQHGTSTTQAAAYSLQQATGERRHVWAAPMANGSFVRGSLYGRAALERELAALEHFPGGRHRALFRAAASAGELAAGGELDADSAASALEAAGRRVRLCEAEVRRTVRDGMRRGAQRPRRAPRDGVMVADRTDAREYIGRWYEESVAAGDWTARTSGTTLKILAGFYLLAMRAGKLRITQSYREIAEAAGVAVGTVSKHERYWSRYVAVVQKGSRTGRALVEVGDHRKTNRSVFQLLPPNRVLVVDGNRPEAPLTAVADLFPAGAPRSGGPGAARLSAMPRAGTVADPALDRWHRAGGSWHVWCLLDDREAADVAALVRASGRTATTIRRQLRALAADGLAVEVGDGGYVRGEASCLVEERQFQGLRRERHRLDRVLFASYLAARFGVEPEGVRSTAA